MPYIKANISEDVFRALLDLNRYDEKTQTRIKAALQERTETLYRLALSLAPMESGELRKRIYMNVTDTGYKIYANVTSGSPVSHLIEYGVRSSVVVPVKKKALAPGADGWFMARAAVPARPARPFFGPAWNAIRPTLEEAVRKAVEP